MKGGENNEVDKEDGILPYLSRHNDRHDPCKLEVGIIPKINQSKIK